MNTYSDNKDILQRLQFGRAGEELLDTIDSLRKTAYRWIRNKYRERGLTPPDPDDMTEIEEEALVEIEADFGAGEYYLRKLEFTKGGNENIRPKGAILNKKAKDAMSSYFHTHYPETYWGLADVDDEATGRF